MTLLHKSVEEIIQEAKIPHSDIRFERLEEADDSVSLVYYNPLYIIGVCKVEDHLSFVMKRGTGFGHDGKQAVSISGFHSVTSILKTCPHFEQMLRKAD